MKLVGVNIKRYREERQITLRDLASKLNVSASFLSQVETGKASPSLSTLKNIADALHTTVGSLIGETEPTATQPVVREKERKSLKQLGKGIKLYLLTSPDPNKQMEPLLFKLDKEANSGEASYRHFGQEFVLVLKGTLEITLNESKYILKKGDSIYFNSSIPHLFRNVSKGTTEALWVVTPPTF
ncbi:MAG: XRE family transcriptional regulator [bacterium]|nr:XRE family transcriptional regulator [bacterium]